MPDHYPTNPLPAAQPEHLVTASDMANTLMDRFGPQEQNEALRLIQKLITEHRQEMIKEAENRVAWLKDSYQQL